jgi:hypothetical protein
MSEFKDHPVKIIIREQWCKPIIRHLRENLGYQLVYFGLPGINCYDLICWLEHIDYVIAIDCGDYNTKEWDFEKANDKIKELNSLLLSFERREEISGFSLYLGFLEEVIFKKRDKNGQEFSFNNSVHIFNLDFCNALTTPFKVVHDGGNIKTYYKTQVIRRLLDLQNDVDNTGASKFIMFVTIHSHFWEEEAKEHFNDGRDETYNQYYETIKELPENERIIRLLRYYFIDIVKTQFTSTEFIPEFFPAIIYNGLGDHILICFTIAGTLFKRRSGVAPFHQNVEEIVNSKFLNATEDGIQVLPKEEDKIEIKNDPISLFEDFKSYQELWLKK